MMSTATIRVTATISIFFELGSSNCARETYLVRVKRTFSVANLNATCVIYYMRVNKIEGNFLFFD